MEDDEVKTIPWYVGCGVVPEGVKLVDLIAGLGDVQYKTKTLRLSHEDPYFKACAEPLWGSNEPMIAPAVDNSNEEEDEEENEEEMESAPLTPVSEPGTPKHRS